MGECLARKDHQAYAVAVAVAYKCTRNLFCRSYAVGIEVACEHRPRDVYRQYYVDSFGIGRGVVFGTLRPSQCNDDEGYGCASQSERQMTQIVSPRTRSLAQTLRRGDAYGGIALHRPPNVVGRERHKHEQQPKYVR